MNSVESATYIIFKDMNEILESLEETSSDYKIAFISTNLEKSKDYENLHPIYSKMRLDETAYEMSLRMFTQMHSRPTPDFYIPLRMIQVFNEDAVFDMLLLKYPRVILGIDNGFAYCISVHKTYHNNDRHMFYTITESAQDFADMNFIEKFVSAVQRICFKAE